MESEDLITSTLEDVAEATSSFAIPTGEEIPAHYYWLVTATVTIKAPSAQDDDEDSIIQGDVRVNVNLTTIERELTQRFLATVQHLAVNSVMASRGLPETRIEGVVIDNIVLLGRMPEEIFNDL